MNESLPLDDDFWPKTYRSEGSYGWNASTCGNIDIMPTLFTRIINREIPGDIIYEDDHVVAFRDIAPQAPVHVIIVTRSEISGIAALPESGDHLHLLNAARTIAANEGLANGYRLVINQGEDGGQTVDHLHVHLLGGRPLAWPPG